MVVRRQGKKPRLDSERLLLCAGGVFSAALVLALWELLPR